MFARVGWIHKKMCINHKKNYCVKKKILRHFIYKLYIFRPVGIYIERTNGI